MKVITVLKSLGTLGAGVTIKGALAGELILVDVMLLGLLSAFLITLARELHKENIEDLEEDLFAIPV